MQPTRQSHSAALGPGVVPSLAVPGPASEPPPARGVPLAPTCGAQALTVDPAALAGQPRKHTQ